MWWKNVLLGFFTLWLYRLFCSAFNHVQNHFEMYLCLGGRVIMPQVPISSELKQLMWHFTCQWVLCRYLCWQCVCHVRLAKGIKAKRQSSLNWQAVLPRSVLMSQIETWNLRKWGTSVDWSWFYDCYSIDRFDRYLVYDIDKHTRTQYAQAQLLYSRHGQSQKVLVNS